MHSRSPYQSNPNFTVLAQAYPDLKPYLTGNTLDFHNDAAQRALTRALLHRDFNLTIDLPSNRLCPPVPNRLNYVLWIQDIVRAHEEILGGLIGGENGINVHGIDIGTGASAIYPLLACSLEPHWQFVATELDPESYTYACTNVQRNKLESQVQVLRVGDDEVGNGQVDRGRRKEGGSPASTVADMDQAENEDPGTTGDGFGDDDGRRRPLPFGFDGLFRLHVGEEDNEDRQGHQEGKTSQDTHTRPSGGGHPQLQVEFTMCNPPFYASAAEVEEGFASKEAGPLGVCTGAPVEMITPGGEARFVGQMVRESAGASSSWDHELPGGSGPSPSYQRSAGQKGGVEQPRTSIAPGGKRALEKPAPGGRSNKRRRIDSEGPVGGDMWASRWYTSMLGKMGSVVEVVQELGACGISNYAITEFVQGQTRRWAVGWSLGGFRLPDSITRIENPNPTLRQLMPPRNTLRFPHLPGAGAGAGQTTAPGLLRHILSSIDGVRVYEGRRHSAGVDGGTRPGFPAGIPNHIQSDDLRRVPVPVLVRASGDTWSRSARRDRKRKEQPRDGSTSSGGLAPPPPAHDRELDIVSAALVCSVLWDRDRDRGGGLDVRWVYGYDRALFESFASHVASMVRASLGGAP